MSTTPRLKTKGFPSSKNMTENKQKIIMYTEVYRKMSEIQDQYIDYIASELMKLYPDLKEFDGPNSAEDWAVDLVNAVSNEDVLKTLYRLESLIQKSKPSNTPIEKSQKSQTEEQSRRIDLLEEQIQILNRKAFYSK